MSEWTPLFRVKHGHKFFAHRDGRWALADDSGSEPDQTDGGVCYLDLFKPIIVYVSDMTGLGMCQIPLYSPTQGRGFHTSTPIEFLNHKKFYWPDWPVKASEGLQNMLKAIKDADLI